MDDEMRSDENGPSRRRFRCVRVEVGAGGFGGCREPAALVGWCRRREAPAVCCRRRHRGDPSEGHLLAVHNTHTSDPDRPRHHRQLATTPEAAYSSPAFLTLLMNLSRVSSSLYGRVCRRLSVLRVGSLLRA